MFATRRLLKGVAEATLPYTVRKNGDSWQRASVQTPFVTGQTKEGQAYIDTKPNGSNNHTVEIGFDGKSVHSLDSLGSIGGSVGGGDGKVTVVLAHGYGQGSGMWSPTLDSIASHPLVDRVVAFDWRAMGGSARDNSPSRHWTYALMPQSIASMLSPTVSRVSSVVDTLASQSKAHRSPAQTVQYFIEHLPGLYDQLKLTDNPVVFVGHSLGGYLGCCFALKYPKQVQSLILASPVGVPYSLNSLLSQNDAHISNREIYEFSQFLGVPFPQLQQQVQQTQDLQPYIKNLSQQLHSNTMLKILMFCWNMGMSHKSVQKQMPTTSVDKLAQGMSMRIFGEKFHSQELIKYIRSLQTVPTAGENAQNALLCMDYSMETATNISRAHQNGEFKDQSKLPQVFPSVFARVPLAPFLHDLKMATNILYGDYDWLRQDGVDDVIRTQAGEHVKTTILNNAGHHLYSNNPAGFNSIITSTVESYLQSEDYAQYNQSDVQASLKQALEPTQPPPEQPTSTIHKNIINLLRKKKPTQTTNTSQKTEPTTLLPIQDAKKRKCTYSSLLYGKFFNHPTKQ